MDTVSIDSRTLYSRLGTDRAPLMLDVRNITENQLFYWHADLARQVCSEAAIPLQKYLRFEDLPFPLRELS